MSTEKVHAKIALIGCALTSDSWHPLYTCHDSGKSRRRGTSCHGRSAALNAIP